MKSLGRTDLPEEQQRALRKAVRWEWFTIGYTVVTISAGEEKLRVLMRGQPQVTVDSSVALSCDPKKMHFFRPDGQALSLA